MKSGEVLDLQFNGWKGGFGGGGDSSNGGSGSSDGSGSGGNNIIIPIYPNDELDPIYTREVLLTHPTTRGIVFPDEDGFTTQEQANEWFYTAIKSIVFDDHFNKHHTITKPRQLNLM